jgi:hypothetical protein
MGRPTTVWNDGNADRPGRILQRQSALGTPSPSWLLDGRSGSGSTVSEEINTAQSGRGDEQSRERGTSAILCSFNAV